MCARERSATSTSETGKSARAGCSRMPTLQSSSNVKHEEKTRRNVCLQTERLALLPLRLQGQRSSLSRLYEANEPKGSRVGRKGGERPRETASRVGRGGERIATARPC